MVNRTEAGARTAVMKAAMVHSKTRTAVVEAWASVRTGKSTYGQYGHSDCDYEFLVHVEPSFLFVVL
jgi:hypothetical protein